MACTNPENLDVSDYIGHRTKTLTLALILGVFFK